MLAINLINCVAFSLTITILIMFYEPLHLRLYWEYFFICFSINISITLLFPQLPFLSLYCLILPLSFHMYKRRKNLVVCVLNTFVVMLVFVLQTILFGSIFIWFSYKRFATDTLSYNVIMAFANIIIAFGIRRYRHGELLNICLIAKNSIYKAILFCCISIVFLSHILSSLPISKDVISYCIVSIIFIVLILCIYVLLVNISHLEKKAHAFELQQKFDEKEKASFEKVIELKHYYLQLFRSCIQFLDKPENTQNYKILSYLDEINKDLDSVKENTEKIQFINNTLIRSLFTQLIHDVSLLPHINLKITLNTSIAIFNINELDLFKLLSILLENALHSTQKQKRGYLHITISQYAGCCIFKISNSRGEEEKTNPYSFGVGLQIVERIIAPYQNMDLETKILKHSMGK